MSILYLGISSKYIHTMPAGWFIAEFLKRKGIEIKEVYRNVNEDFDSVLNGVIKANPDILLLSVYIFNVEFIKKLIPEIRKRLKNCKIIIGGPEAHSDMDFDHMIVGEGEEALYELLVKGGERIIYAAPIKDLDALPSPYTPQRLEQCKNKLLYYEASRGCPFHCSYCMASLSRGVRYFSLDRVKSDLKAIVSSGIKIIKFTDRTFNANAERAALIFDFIYENFKDAEVCFHFEVAGDLFDDRALKTLEKMPKGLIQIEAGVQTLNPNTLKSIDRVFDKDKFMSAIKKIISWGNIHTHLDLIAGLPQDSLETFSRSFNEVYELKPHNLQLGFLKFLKGTRLYNTYKASFQKTAPYEIIDSPHMSGEDLALLKRVEFALQRVYNSGRFPHTLEYLSAFYPSPFELYKAMSDFFACKNITKGAYEEQIYQSLLEFGGFSPKIKELLRFDYLLTHKTNSAPKFLRKDYSKEFKRFLNATKASAHILYAEFDHIPNAEKGGTALFDYSHLEPVTKRYRYEIIKQGAE